MERVTLIRLTRCSALPDYSGDIHTEVFLLLFPSQEVHHILSLTPKCPPPSTAPPSLNSLPFELSVRGCIRVPISRIRTELRCDWLVQWYRARELAGQKVISLWRDYGRWLSGPMTSRVCVCDCVWGMCWLNLKVRWPLTSTSLCADPDFEHNCSQEDFRSSGPLNAVWLLTFVG